MWQTYKYLGNDITCFKVPLILFSFIITFMPSSQRALLDVQLYIFSTSIIMPGQESEKRQAAREAVDVLHEISSLLV